MDIYKYIYIYIYIYEDRVCLYKCLYRFIYTLTQTQTQTIHIDRHRHRHRQRQSLSLSGTLTHALSGSHTQMYISTLTDIGAKGGEHEHERCCSVLQCIAVCCSVLQCVLQCVAVCCSVLTYTLTATGANGCEHELKTYIRIMYEYGPIVLALVKVVYIHILIYKYLHTHPDSHRRQWWEGRAVLQCIALYCSVLQFVALYCSVLQFVAVC